MIKIDTEPFGKTASGSNVTRFVMENENSMRIAVIDYGCTVQSILVPDRDGVLRDVALGYDTAASYEKGGCFFGAFVGRYANRIKNAAFTLNGKTYHLSKNEGENHLHGTFSHRVHEGVIEENAVAFLIESPPSEEGYPGTLKGKVLYRLTEDNALEIEYTAVCDEDTVINLTNHTYFNLNGQDGSDILDHTMRLHADSFTEINEEILTTGHILRVDDTPFDFRREKPIGADIASDDRQLRLTAGYDHHMIINGTTGTLKEAAVVKSHASGIAMTVLTTQPGFQLYTGNFVHEDAAPHGKGSVRYPRYGGFCLETQGFPDAVHHPDFPDSVLKKGDIYHSKTIYRFTVDHE
jgi:aldose 1-epimerase